MNEQFPNPHPSLIGFVQTMEERARDKQKDLEKKRRENFSAPPQENCNIPEIPDSPFGFKP